MAYSHLINCVLLGFGPYFVVYKGKNLLIFHIFLTIFINFNKKNINF